MSDFLINVEPALTLADTTFGVKVNRKIEGAVPGGGQLYLAVEAALKARDKAFSEPRPKSRPVFGYTEFMGPSELVVIDNTRGARVSLEPLAIGHRTVENAHSDLPQQASTEFSASIETESTIGWETSITAGVTFTVGVEVGGEFAKASASTSYSLSATVGRTASHSKKLSVGTSEGDSIEVAPGEDALIVGLLEKGSIRFEPVFGWRPTGWVVVSTAEGLPHIGRMEASELAPYLKLRTWQAEIVLPFASEARSEVVAPLKGGTSASNVERAIDQVLVEASQP